ncbi:MAG TPA: DUF4331 family protein [Polyangiaceae bacterium]|nr:DUF4331 family protein [Polyangiaceae bacterium]
MQKTYGLGIAVLAMSIPALAADHVDSPAAIAEPTADITDVYAWMTEDAAMLNVIVNVAPFAGATAEFSTATQYAVHIGSSMAYGEESTEHRLVCQFYTEHAIECWLGDTYLAGDPRDAEGLTSDDGGLRVFAGLRDDPFFFELNGFKATVDSVVAAVPALVENDRIDANGCPLLDSDTGAALRAQLMSGAAAQGEGGAPGASDTFAGQNVLSLVFQIDKELVNAGGDLLSVWASTHAEGVAP